MDKTQKGKESVEKVIYHDLSGGERTLRLQLVTFQKIFRPFKIR